MTPAELAPFLYARHTDALGGKDERGANFPMWAEFSDDPNNHAAVMAWLATSACAIELLVTGE